MNRSSYRPSIVLKSTHYQSLEGRNLRFTVLTPTYNRAHVLGRVFASLCAQTFRDFEWLIVDDGSTDNTRELVASWKADFPIRYVWQTNRGKHTAMNLGVSLAAGEFIAQLDSDDTCLPQALERFDYRWRQIPNPEKFAAVVGLCVDEKGQIVGSTFPGDYVDAFTPGQARALVNRAERWGIIRTDIWRQFPAPEFPGERFLIKGLVQNRILRHYAARYFNEPVRVYFRSPDSLTNSSDWRWRDPRGAFLYYRELLRIRGLRPTTRLNAAINALRFMPLALYRAVTALPPGNP